MKVKHAEQWQTMKIVFKITPDMKPGLYKMDFDFAKDDEGTLVDRLRLFKLKDGAGKKYPNADYLPFIEVE